MEQQYESLCNMKLPLNVRCICCQAFELCLLSGANEHNPEEENEKVSQLSETTTE